MKTTQEVAERLVELCTSMQFDTAVSELYDDNITSREPQGAMIEFVEGKEAVIQKGIQFNEMVEEFHALEVSEPIVAGNHFSVRMNMDVTMKGAPRSSMDEIALYHVKDGKIIAEQFFYEMPPQE
ncbi:MAG: SnoaL-like domain-containing protein [Flavobacteriales bacterium]